MKIGIGTGYLVNIFSGSFKDLLNFAIIALFQVKPFTEEIKINFKKKGKILNKRHDKTYS